jgi:hypothetical protein
MNITFEKKFTDKELDEFIDLIYRNHNSNPHDSYIFDLSEVEYIGNHNYLIRRRVKFKYFLLRD